MTTNWRFHLSFVARWVDDLYVATAFYRRPGDSLAETKTEVEEYEAQIRNIYVKERFGMKSENAEIFVGMMMDYNEAGDLTTEQAVEERPWQSMRYHHACGASPGPRK